MCGISIKARFHTMRTTGTYVTRTTLGESVRSFVPHPLPPAEPALTPQSYEAGVHKAEMALARLSGVAGLVPSVEWPLYSAIRKEALLTSQIEGTQATLTDLFDNEAGLGVANTDDGEEVSNYLRAFRLVRDSLHDPRGLPLSVRLLCDAHRLLLNGARGAGKQPGELRRSQNWIGGTRPGNAVFVPPPPEHVATMPRFTIEQVRMKLQTTFPTATAAVSLLEELGIVAELTGQKKNRSYSYSAYVQLLSR